MRRWFDFFQADGPILITLRPVTSFSVLLVWVLLRAPARPTDFTSPMFLFPDFVLMAFFISAFALSITISITVYLSPNVIDETRPRASDGPF